MMPTSLTVLNSTFDKHYIPRYRASSLQAVKALFRTRMMSLPVGPLGANTLETDDPPESC